jgi:hypothetical protein
MAGKGQPKTGGRRKGTPNKLTRDLKEAILLAGEMLSITNSSAYAALLGKVLPSTIQGPGQDGAHKITTVEWRVHDPKVEE